MKIAILGAMVEEITPLLSFLETTTRSPTRVTTTMKRNTRE